MIQKLTLALLLMLSVSTVHANMGIPLLDPAIGHGLDIGLAIAGRSRLAKSFRPLDDAHLRGKAWHALNLVLHNSGREFRYDDPDLVVIAGTPDEPNAFSTGPTIYVSKAMIEQLDIMQLAAVIAHELAHAEEGHLTQRMTHGLAAVVLQFGKLVASDVGSILAGNADHFMEELWRKGHWQMILEMLESASLGQEMQADCYASKWLLHMKRRGFPISPDTIADAMNRLMGSWIEEDPFMGPRLRNLRIGAYERNSCD